MISRPDAYHASALPLSYPAEFGGDHGNAIRRVDSLRHFIATVTFDLHNGSDEST